MKHIISEVTMTLKELKKCQFGLTHAGIFHADDVFATAFIKIINPNIKIIRSNNISKEFSGIIYDIGNGEFDHHNSSNEQRSNGIPYAAFGKLWQKFALELFGNYVYKKIDEKLIEALDLSDNTGKSDTLCLAISSFNPKDDELVEKSFEEAVDFAKKILENLIVKEKQNEKDEKEVFEIYSKSKNKKIIVLDKYLHYEDTLCSKDTLYVIFPSKRGGFMAQSVAKRPNDVELKKPFPERWLIDLPPYLTFCHTSRYLICADTLNDILLACNEAIKES